MLWEVISVVPDGEACGAGVPLPLAEPYKRSLRAALAPAGHEKS